MSRGWAKASACCLQTTLSCAFLCHIVSLQYLSRSSLHRLAGLPCRLFLSYGLQLVTREVHRSSLRRLICPAQDHFIFLTVLIISMTFVLSLTQMLVFLSLYVMLSILLSILVCAAASLFCACLVSVHVSAPYGPFLLKLPYYHQKMYLVFDIFCFYKFYIFLHDNGQVYLS